MTDLNYNIPIIFLFSFISYFLIIKNKNFFYKFNPNYNPVQKIHLNYVPPLGGLIIFISFYLLNYFNTRGSIYFEMHIIIPSLIIIAIGLIDDIFGGVSATSRFIIIFISSLIFVLFNKNLPVLHISYFGDIINDNHLIKILFYSLCLTALSNGLNMIDGMNGLSGFTSLSIIFCLLIIIFSFGAGNTRLISLLFLFLCILVFLIFNFPFGKIFIGNSGAYWIGWILGVSLIDTFSILKINTWSAGVILFYPSMEVLFSIVRKLIQKKSPFVSDTEHLHLIVFKSICGPIQRSTSFNSFTTLCLMPLWASPPILTILILAFPSISSIILILMIFFYLLYYFIIPFNKIKNFIF